MHRSVDVQVLVEDTSRRSVFSWQGSALLIRTIDELCGNIIRNLPKSFHNHDCEVTLKWHDASGHRFYVDALHLGSYSLQAIQVCSPLVASVSLFKHQQPNMVIARMHPQKPCRQKRWLLPSVAQFSESKDCFKKCKTESWDSNECGGYHDSCYLGTSSFTLLYPDDQNYTNLSNRRKKRSMKEIVWNHHQKQSSNKQRSSVSTFLTQESTKNALISDQDDLALKQIRQWDPDSVRPCEDLPDGVLHEFLSRIKSKKGILKFSKATRIDSPELFVHLQTQRKEERKIKVGHRRLLQKIEDRIYSEVTQDELTELANFTTTQRRLNGSLQLSKTTDTDTKRGSVEHRIQELVKDPDGLQILLMEAVKSQQNCKTIDE